MDRRILTFVKLLIPVFFAWLVFVMIFERKTKHATISEESIKLIGNAEIGDIFIGVAGINGEAWNVRSHEVGYFTATFSENNLNSSIKTITSLLDTKCDSFEVDNDYLVLSWDSLLRKFAHASCPVQIGDDKSVVLYTWKTTGKQIEMYLFKANGRAPCLYVSWIILKSGK